MDIGAWLRGLGLGQYERAFRDNDIDVTVLPGLTMDDLKEIGVTSVGHRRLMLQAVAALKAAAAPAIPVTRMAEAVVAPAAHGDVRELGRLHGPERPARTRGAGGGAPSLSGRRGRADRPLRGRGAKFTRGGDLAYLGWPRAHEDDAVRAFRVVAERAARSRFEARRTGLVLPLVGREPELALLRERWRLARAGQGQAVLLSGEPGIGKSRFAGGPRRTRLARTPRRQGQLGHRPRGRRGKPLPPDLEEAIARRADGQPPFVDELTEAVLESGQLREMEGGWVLEGVLPVGAIPSSWQASFMARLDRRAPGQAGRAGRGLRRARVRPRPARGRDAAAGR